jgi:SanA protein
LKTIGHLPPAIGALAAGVCGAFLAWSNWWVSRAGQGRLYSRVEEIPIYDVALVLGAAPKLGDGRPNLFFVYRMDAAAKLYSAGKVRRLILSGNARGNGYNEAAAMKRELLARNLPAEAMLLDTGGIRTLDSVIRAREVFGAKRLIVVSQEFHNRRALFFCDHHSVDAVALNAESVAFSTAPRTWVRELLARAVAVLDVYVFNTRPRFGG